MMEHSLRIQLRHCPGAVLRAIGLMERRGFRLETCELAEARNDRQAMHVRVSSERAPELLKRQLERLHDVLQVELKSPAAKDAGQAPAVDLAGKRTMSGSQ